MTTSSRESVVSARLPAGIRLKIEAFAAQHKLSRSDAISLLISQGLNAIKAAAHEPALPRQAFV
jgi:hypothetical protein